MSKFRSQCLNCRTAVNVPNTLEGTAIRCPKCKEKFVASQNSVNRILLKEPSVELKSAVISSQPETLLTDEKPVPTDSKENTPDETYSVTLSFAVLIQTLACTGMLASLFGALIALILSSSPKENFKIGVGNVLLISAGTFLHCATLFVLAGACHAAVKFFKKQML